MRIAKWVGWSRLDTILLTVCAIGVLQRIEACRRRAGVRAGATAVKDAGLVLKIESVGRMPAATNAASPVPVGGALLLIDQKGSLFRWDGSATQPLLLPTSLPAVSSPWVARPS
jgi:hypothetical protein